MLVHKATMGVLDEIWTGRQHKGPDGVLVPLCQEARLADFPELAPSEWWEVPRNSLLGKRIRRFYPLLRPVVGPAGELVDVEPLHPDIEQTTQEVRRKDALRRGYRQAGRVRPQGIMAFLNCTETYHKGPGTQQRQTGRTGPERKEGVL